jgi:hypothetical protein
MARCLRGSHRPSLYLAASFPARSIRRGHCQRGPGVTPRCRRPDLGCKFARPVRGQPGQEQAELPAACWLSSVFPSRVRASAVCDGNAELGPLSGTSPMPEPPTCIVAAATTTSIRSTNQDRASGRTVTRDSESRSGLRFRGASDSPRSPAMAAPLASGLLGARWATEIAQAPPRRYLVSDSNVTRDYRWDCHGSPGPLADSARLITMPVGASHFRRLHRIGTKHHTQTLRSPEGWVGSQNSPNCAQNTPVVDSG